VNRMLELLLISHPPPFVFFHNKFGRSLGRESVCVKSYL
jgi:hypothetical protein